MWSGIAIPLFAILLGVSFWLYRRHRRRNEPRMISFVALLREPMLLEPTVVARLAGKAWNADLGDGMSEGPDGFVVGAGPLNTIIHAGQMYLLNCLPHPYVDDLDQAMSSISDLRLRNLFSQHQAWFSCDILGINGSSSAEQVRDAYCQLGPLFAELLDDNCLMIFLPELSAGFAVTPETEAALRSTDPVAELLATQLLPIVQVAPDDPLMQKAQQQARDEWARFTEAFESRRGDNFSVKAPITAGGNTEFIWVSVTTIEGDRIYGELGNDPGDLGELRLGSKVSTPIADLNDWCYIDSHGDLQGGFTITAVQQAARRNRED